MSTLVQSLPTYTYRIVGRLPFRRLGQIPVEGFVDLCSKLFSTSARMVCQVLVNMVGLFPFKPSVDSCLGICHVTFKVWSTFLPILYLRLLEFGQQLRLEVVGLILLMYSSTYVEGCFSTLLVMLFTVICCALLSFKVVSTLRTS